MIPKAERRGVGIKQKKLHEMISTVVFYVA